MIQTRTAQQQYFDNFFGAQQDLFDLASILRGTYSLPVLRLLIDSEDEISVNEIGVIL